MVLTISFVPHLSNLVLVLFCGIVLLFLLKSAKLTDKLWLASVASIVVVVLISIGQIVSYNNLAEQLRDKESSLDTLKIEYAKLKSTTESARAEFSDARQNVALSRRELDDLRNKVTAEFERTIREIRGVYANISDEELNRRFNNAVRKARQNFQDNVFK